MARAAALAVFFLACVTGAAVAQSKFSTCESGGTTTLKLFDTASLAPNCTNATMDSTTYYSYGCLAGANVGVTGCQVKIASTARFATENFPCYAIDFVGPLVAEDSATLSGKVNDLSAQLNFCSNHSAVCATLLTQGTLPITFSKNGSNYVFTSGGCSYKYRVAGNSSTTLLVKSASMTATPAAGSSSPSPSNASRDSAPASASPSPSPAKSGAAAINSTASVLLMLVMLLAGILL